MLGLAGERRIERRRLEISTDQGDAKLQGLVETRLEGNLAQAQGCRVHDRHETYRDTNESFQSQSFHPD